VVIFLWEGVATCMCPGTQVVPILSWVKGEGYSGRYPGSCRFLGTTIHLLWWQGQCYMLRDNNLLVVWRLSKSECSYTFCPRNWYCTRFKLLSL